MTCIDVIYNILRFSVCDVRYYSVNGDGKAPCMRCPDGKTTLTKGEDIPNPPDPMGSGTATDGIGDGIGLTHVENCSECNPCTVLNNSSLCYPYSLPHK